MQKLRDNPRIVPIETSETIPSCVKQIDAMWDCGIRVPLIVRTTALLLERVGARVDVIHERNPFSGKASRVEIRNAPEDPGLVMLRHSLYEPIGDAWIWFYGEN